jgi:hypothetical protein
MKSLTTEPIFLGFIFEYQTKSMKKKLYLILFLAFIVFASSCTTSRSSAGGGCSMNRNMVGYN